MRNPARILVVGESCKDVFVHCDTTRLAPEAPIPVLDVKHVTTNPGMAKNLARNIKAIHPHCDIVTNRNWHRITKTRYVHHETGEGYVRVDAPHDIARIQMEALPLDSYDVVVVSDYDKGFLHEDDIAHICERHPLVFVDTKKPLGRWLKGATYVKVNDHEYRRSSPLPAYLEKKVIRTLGAKGALHRGVRYPALRVTARGVSGAGDSFLAALVVHYVSSKNIEDAIRFANKCAAEVVTKPGVTILERSRQVRSGEGA